MTFKPLPPTSAADVDSVTVDRLRGMGVTIHDEFARCPECRHATVGLARPWQINHAEGCSMPEIPPDHEREISDLERRRLELIAELAAVNGRLATLQRPENQARALDQIGQAYDRDRPDGVRR